MKVGLNMTAFWTGEFSERIARLQKLLRQREVSLAIFTQNPDIYYYTGSVQPLYLLVPDMGEPFILARKSLNRIREEAVHIELGVFNNSKDLIGLMERFKIGVTKQIGLTLDVTSYTTVKRFQQLCGGAAIIDLSFDIRMLRLVKSEREIAIQTAAGKIIAHMPDLVKEQFRPGMTELELSAAIENYLRLQGHGLLIRCRKEGIECLGVCSAGENTLAGTKFDGICAGLGTSQAVPYGAAMEVIPKSTPVLLDYALVYEGYHVDQTRMFSWGEPSAEVLKAYQAMIEVEQVIREHLKPGVLWQEVYEQASKCAAGLGYEKEFMGLGPEKVRFVGHGVGLELDEPPFLAPKMEYPLEAGMVVAVEPKVALPGIGVVGIEDTLVIRDGSPELLTGCSPKFLIV
jgi:Xaa-Pro dipeptidase